MQRVSSSHVDITDLKKPIVNIKWTLAMNAQLNIFIHEHLIKYISLEPNWSFRLAVFISIGCIIARVFILITPSEYLFCLHNGSEKPKDPVRNENFNSYAMNTNKKSHFTRQNIVRWYISIHTIREITHQIKKNKIIIVLNMKLKPGR